MTWDLALLSSRPRSAATTIGFSEPRTGTRSLRATSSTSS